METWSSSRPSPLGTDFSEGGAGFGCAVGSGLSLLMTILGQAMKVSDVVSCQAERHASGASV